MKKILISLLSTICLIACNNKKVEVNDSTPPELAQLRQKIANSPKNASLYQELALYFLNTNELDSALANIITAIRLDSTNDQYYMSLGDIYMAQANTDATEEALEQAISINPQNNEAHLKLAELHFMLRHYKESQEEAQKAIEISNNNPKAYLILGWNFRELGDTASAIGYYMKAADQDAEYYDAYMELGFLYHCRHNPLAISYYNNALNCRPNDFLALYDLGMFYQETGEYEKAISEYKMILQNDSTNKLALHNIGWIYHELGQYETAVAFFTKAIQQDETFIAAIYNRGLCFEKLKQYDYARQDYMYCLKLQSDYELAIEGLNNLDKLQ